MITVRRTLTSLAAILVCAAIAAAIPLACRNVLGIEERGSDALTCDAYCDAIAAACDGSKPSTPVQYGSRAGCMGLCKTFPVGKLTDTGVNTLGCRMREVGLIGQEGSCVVAGPSGDSQCGFDCDSFCTSAVQVCPTEVGDMDACMKTCGMVPDCQQYDVEATYATVLPDAYTLQCRLFHLTSATLDPTTHCPHVIGIGKCGVDAGGCDGG